MALDTNLVAYYSCEDTNGTDATGRGNTLTLTNSPANATGRQGNGLDLVAASSQYLTRASTSDLAVGDIDFTVAIWVKPPASSQGYPWGLMGKWPGAGNYEYILYINSSAQAQFFVSANGTASVNAGAVPGTAVTANAWNLIVGYHDSVNNVIGCKVNNGTTATTSTSAGVRTGTAAFQIGRNDDGDTNYVKGVIDEAAMWKQVLSSGDLTSLWNSGNGLAYTDIVVARALPVSSAPRIPLAILAR